MLKILLGGRAAYKNDSQINTSKSCRGGWMRRGAPNSLFILVGFREMRPHCDCYIALPLVTKADLKMCDVGGCNKGIFSINSASTVFSWRTRDGLSVLTILSWGTIFSIDSVSSVFSWRTVFSINSILTIFPVS